MKFKDLEINKHFKLIGNDVVYTKKAFQKASCCTKDHNAWTLVEGAKKKTFILVGEEDDVEAVE